MFKLLTFLYLVVYFVTAEKLLSSIVQWNKNGLVNNSLLAHNRIIESSGSSCKPEKKSFLSLVLSKKDIKILLVVLDGYPSSSMYSALTGERSILHERLSQQKNSIYKEKFNIIAFTPLSLSYILAGIEPQKALNRVCIYPFQNSQINLNHLLANNHFYQSDSSCIDFFRSPFVILSMRALYFYHESLQRLPHSLQEKMRDIFEPVIQDMTSSSCSIADTAITNQIITKLRYISKDRSFYLASIHEMKAHDSVLNADYYSPSRLRSIDYEYYSTLSTLISEVRRDSLVDYIIILSDHGPRTQYWKSHSSEKLLKLKDMDFYSYFSYVMPVSRASYRNHSFSTNLMDSFPNNENRRLIYNFDSATIKLVK